MKKFFTLIAAVAMAVSANAQKTYSLAGLSMADLIYESTEWSVNAKDATQLDYIEASKTKYAILEVKDTPVMFAYKNSSKKEKSFKVGDTYLQTGGKGFRLSVDELQKGDVVTLSVASKGGSAVAFEIVSGATGDIPTFDPKSGDELTYKEVTLTATDDQILLVDNGGGFAINEVKVTPASTGISSAVSEVSSDTDAATYNVLGQKVASNTKGLVIKNGKKFINK